MPTLFRVLFVCPAGTQFHSQAYLTPSKGFPIDPQFVVSHQKANDYLAETSTLDYPDVIILDEALGLKNILSFLSTYRSRFYPTHMDTLLFIGAPSKPADHLPSLYPKLISNTLQKPFNKRQFMHSVLPHLTFYMV